MNKREDDLKWKEQELELLCSSARVLDRIGSWMCIHGDDLDENTCDRLLLALTSATQTSCQFFLNTPPRQLDQDIVDLKTLLICAISSCLTMFWMDDPITGRGLNEVATRSGFTRACGRLIQDCPSSNVLYLICPLLVQLPSESWVPALLSLNECSPIAILCEKEWNIAIENRMAARSYFAGMTIIQILIEQNNNLDKLERYLTIEMIDLGMSHFSSKDDLESKCVVGTLHILRTFVVVSEKSSTTREIIGNYLKSTDEMIKNHVKYDGNDDYGESDYAELGIKLSWKELRRVCELVRLECL